MPTRVTLSALVISIALPIPGSAQEVVPPLFASNDLVELRIEANFDKIHKERKAKAKSYPGTLRIVDAAAVRATRIRGTSVRVVAVNIILAVKRIHAAATRTTATGRARISIVTISINLAFQ